MKQSPGFPADCFDGPSRGARARVVLAAAAVVLAGVLAAGVTGADAYEAIAVTDGGTLTGVVRFLGTPPPATLAPVTRQPDVCGERSRSETLVLDADRGVAGSVVLIEGIPRGKKPPGEIRLDTRRCAFVPHVAAGAAGMRARVRNGDGIVHNARGVLGRTTVFNVAVPNKDQEVDITRRLTRPGAVRLTCDVHPHMRGWLYVHDSPYVAVTDEHGAYRIDAVPPGTYRVTMWHEPVRARGRAVTVTRTVTIRPGASTALDFRFGVRGRIGDRRGPAGSTSDTARPALAERGGDGE